MTEDDAIKIQELEDAIKIVQHKLTQEQGKNQYLQNRLNSATEELRNLKNEVSEMKQKESAQSMQTPAFNDVKPKITLDDEIIKMKAIHKSELREKEQIIERMSQQLVDKAPNYREQELHEKIEQLKNEIHTKNELIKVHKVCLKLEE